MTTVGYGDTFPITTGGRIIGAMTMVIGILCVALPTTVLGIQFSESFAQVTEEKEIEEIKLKHRRKGEIMDEFNQELQELDELHAELLKLLPSIEQNLLKVTEGNKGRNEAVRNNFGRLGDSTAVAVDNCKKFLRSTLPPENTA